MFGTSTGVFGAPSSTPAFGASSSPALGSSMPSFGAPSTPAFGSSSSSFGKGLKALAEVNPLYAKRFDETIYRYSGAARYLEELQHTDLESKIQGAIGDAVLKEAITAKVRASDISEKKARIWSLQKQRRRARAKLNAEEITQEEFNLEDAALASEVQAEKEAVEVLKQEASAATAVSDAELHKRVREEVLAKHEKSISNTKAYLMSFSLL
ncbi:uncharacterized protein A4U43_UnF6430 [Asparagus officinalis]|uniref:Nucleoporin Nup54 alpha-helical domain-containing protein n=1 Tax=Asparagus officinalis TaxID=4686 RepID=A0A1R3L6G8_ASPOF|nr:uncharacterized protein A4U43_UnF6430 [Asparagus officinalis]